MSEMRYYGGAQLSWTLGKTKFSFSPFPALPPFPQSSPVLSSKQRQLWKFKKYQSWKKYLQNSFSHYKKMWLRVFRIFHEALGDFVQKEWIALKKGHSQGQLNHLQPHTLWAKVFLGWSDKPEMLFACPLERGAPITPAHFFNLTLILTPATEVKLL